MNRRDAIQRLAATSAVLALPALAQSNRIVLGQSAAFTGPAAQLGIQMNMGARIYFNALNAGGGINGASVSLVDSVVSNVRRLRLLMPTIGERSLRARSSSARSWISIRTSMP